MIGGGYNIGLFINCIGEHHELSQVNYIVNIIFHKLNPANGALELTGNLYGHQGGIWDKGA